MPVVARLPSTLPNGWHADTKTKLYYEWRCPHGEICGKNGKLMYKKDDRDKLLDTGSWHLNTPEMHPNPAGGDTLEDARVEAENGVTEATYEAKIWVEEEGNEYAAPEDARGSAGKGGGKGNGQSDRSQRVSVTTTVSDRGRQQVGAGDPGHARSSKGA